MESVAKARKGTAARIGSMARRARTDEERARIEQDEQRDQAGLAMSSERGKVYAVADGERLRKFVEAFSAISGRAIGMHRRGRDRALVVVQRCRACHGEIETPVLPMADGSPDIDR